MNYYTAMMPERSQFLTGLDGSGVLVCDNPLECWEYAPCTIWTEIWRVFPLGPVEHGTGCGKAERVLLTRRLETWELAAYTTSLYACVTTGQRIQSGGIQHVYAFGRSIVSAQDGCRVTAFDDAVVTATDDVSVEGSGRATVVLLGNSRCYAKDQMHVTLMGPYASVTYPKKSDVDVDLVEANPKNVLADGRLFTANAFRKWNKEMDEQYERDTADGDIWDATVPSPIHDKRPALPEPQVGGDGTGGARSARESLAALFGEADETDGGGDGRGDSGTPGVRALSRR